jgi:hypothetical protein
MKQVIIYNQLDVEYHGGKRYINEDLFRFLHCQIDISLHLGWKPEDIILGTNFDFEYRGVKNHHLTNVCTWSGFNNFWFGALELLRNGVIDDDFWLHDHDSWPIRKFNFPEYNGEIAGCEYIGTEQWNCASIYCKKSCADTLEYIVDTLMLNKEVIVSSDEIIISHLRAYSPIKNELTSINTTYNVGVTHGPLRLAAATKPVNVLSFNPGVEIGRERLMTTGLYNEIPKDILEIYQKYFPI